MCNFDIIITCSGTGSRLAPITDYLNKSLVKLGDKAIISHIIESYPEQCRFIVTLGYKSESVKDYLSIAHPDAIIEYVHIDNYDGEGSSLLYSLSKTFDLLDKPFYYNACDTYIKTEHNFSQNTALVAKAHVPNQYRRFNNGIDDAPATMGELCYTGVCFVEDFKTFIAKANETLSKESSLSDANVLQKMDFAFEETDQWMDIGNFISLEQARKNFNNQICVLEKHNQETYCQNGKIIKFFGKKDTVDKLFKRSVELSDCGPNCGALGNFLYYDYIPGDTLSDVLSEDLLTIFLQWCEDNLWKKQELKHSRATFFHNFYITKADDRIISYQNKHEPNHPWNLEINFRKMASCLHNMVFGIGDDYAEHVIPSRAHGHLVFENVIKTEDGFVLIDWREGFVGDETTGDMVYDIAKMKHNLIFDHKAIKDKKFFVKIEKTKCLFDPGTPEKNIKLINRLDQWCEQKNISVKYVDLIVALIEISSSGVHTGEDASLLYYMGWYNLNKVLNNA